MKTIDGVQFVFSTLWSRISPEKQFIIQQCLSDLRVIRNNEKRLTVDDYNQIHSECRLFLEEALKNQTEMPTVVITHHPPTFMNYPEKYANSTINEAFGTEMFNFIEDNKIDYWIYGHHHCNVPDFTVGKTKLVTNQLGYIKYNENQNFNSSRLISI